jgi:pimeloyl-ACP methyl ester carboxylesterase
MRIVLLLSLATGPVAATLAQSGEAVPYTVAVPTDVLDDLRVRLGRTRWPDQLPGSGWVYGTDTGYLRELADYWADDYDWRAIERDLNVLPHYRAEIDGLNIHFIHERSDDPDAIPLLILHGWPSSFVQMLDLVPLLAHQGEQRFHVVVASLPGFGFSEIPDRAGIGFPSIARIMSSLMTDVLGYERYGARGSDLGGATIQQLALARPEELVGVHLSGIIGTGGVDPSAELSDAERAFVDATAAMNQAEVAYARLHMTKPQTLGAALNDSPVGLAAWIVEKFRSWGDTGGDIESRFSKDDLLTNLTVYWVTGTINASMRTYYEFVREQGLTGRVEVPVGMLMSSKDLFPPAPREWGERLYNVVRWTETDTGGHFLEWEEPELVAAELRAFFAGLE